MGCRGVSWGAVGCRGDGPGPRWFWAEMTRTQLQTFRFLVALRFVYHVTRKMAEVQKSISEIENASKSSLKCFVFNFSVASILKNVHSIEQTVANRCLCLQKIDGCVEFVHLDRCDRSPYAGALPNVRR